MSLRPKVKTRELSDQENKALRVITHFENLAWKKKLYAEFTMTLEAFKALELSRCAQPSKVTNNRAKDTVEVVFRIDELKRYVDYICRVFNVKVSVDGSVTLKDGIYLPRKESNQ